MKIELIQKRINTKQLDEYIVQCSDTILDVMKRINTNAQKIAYVCNNQELVGTVSDGDIRRYIIKNGDLNAEVRIIANREYRYVTHDNEEEAQRIMKKCMISSIPLITNRKRINKIFFLQSVRNKAKEHICAPVVIMAGGTGSRLQPYTNILPKPLMPIGDRTITEHIMDRFLEYGCSSFKMILNYKHRFIKSYFSDLEKKYDINYFVEDQFLGTAGGLYLLRDEMQESFFVSNCDILIEEDFAEIYSMHLAQKNVITMVCAIKGIRLPYGTVEVSKTGDVKGINEKPELSFLTNTGFYILSPEFIQHIPPNRSTPITDIIQDLIRKKKKVGVFPISEDQWFDMGQFEEMERMKRHLSV